MTHGSFPISVLLVCSLGQAVLAGYEGRPQAMMDEGRPQTMMDEAPLVGVVRAVPIGNLVPTMTPECCPCPAPKRIMYPARYIVINRNPLPPPSMHLRPAFLTGVPMMSQKPEPTPETSGGSNNGGDS